MSRQLESIRAKHFGGLGNGTPTSSTLMSKVTPSRENGFHEEISDSEEPGVTSITVDIPVEENEDSFVSEEQSVGLFSSAEVSSEGSEEEEEGFQGDFAMEEEEECEILDEGDLSPPSGDGYDRTKKILEDLVADLKACEISGINHEHMTNRLQDHAKMSEEDYLMFVETMRNAIARELSDQLDEITKGKNVKESCLRSPVYTTFQKQIDMKNKQLELSKREEGADAPEDLSKNEEGLETTETLRTQLKELRDLQRKCKENIYKNVDDTHKCLKECIDQTQDTAEAYRRGFYSGLFAEPFDGTCVEGFGDEGSSTVTLNTFGKVLTAIANAKVVCLDVSSSVIEIDEELWNMLDVDKWVEEKRMAGCKDEEYLDQSRKFLTDMGQMQEAREGSPMRRFDLPSMMRCALSGISIFPGDRVIACRLFVSFKDTKTISDMDFAKNASVILDQHTCCFFIHADLDAFTFRPKPHGLEERQDELDMLYSGGSTALTRDERIALEYRELIEDQAEANRDKTKGMIAIDPSTERSRRQAKRDRDKGSTPTIQVSSSSEDDYEEFEEEEDAEDCVFDETLEEGDAPVKKRAKTNRPVANGSVPKKVVSRKRKQTDDDNEDEGKGMGGIRKFLESIEYGRLYSHFQRGQATMVQELPYLEESDFEEMGLNKLHMKRLKRKIEEAKLDG